MMRTPLRALLALATLASAPLALACNNHPLIGSPTVNGTYALQSVNGKGLPYVAADAPPIKREILDDQISLYQGFTYARTAHVRVTENGQTSTIVEQETGTFSLMGNSIFLTTSDGRTQKSAVINPPHMTFVFAGVTTIYRK